MIEAIIHVLRTGCPWRDLPSQFGPWSSVYTRFRRWSQAGLWAQILDLITERAHGNLRFLDATHIKVHQDAANPAGGQHLQAFGRTKGGLNTKLTVTVDSNGKVLQATLAPGKEEMLLQPRKSSLWRGNASWPTEVLTVITSATG